jgi:hypothetical protein
VSVIFVRFKQIEVGRHILVKLLNEKCHENPFDGLRLFHEHASGRKQGFRRHAKARKKTQKYIFRQRWTGHGTTDWQMYTCYRPAVLWQ